MKWTAILCVIFFPSCRSVEEISPVPPTPYGFVNTFPNLTFEHPLDLQHAGDGSQRLFVVEQAGRIRVIDPLTGTSGLFLDITARVSDEGGEEGLLGLAFHPDFEFNGYCYVNYTASGPRRTVISRFGLDSANPEMADPGTELVLLEFDQPYTNHNGGQLQFGPDDGYLYVATGDGGSAGDPGNNGQSLSTLLGKILRIDVDNPSGGLNYGIPPDNPYVGTGFREEIYAYGLRNPWRFSFDNVTGLLWAGDVGQDTREEIDIVRKGGNYGWRIMEGSLCFDPPSGCDTTGLILPVTEYGRDEGESVTGGFVYRGAGLPELVGMYIYGDYISGRVWALDSSGPAPPTLLADAAFNISSFGVDEAGELLICNYGGTIHRLTQTTP
jgi:glucose/arabinose dehydrogenase